MEVDWPPCNDNNYTHKYFEKAKIVLKSTTITLKNKWTQAKGKTYAKIDVYLENFVRIVEHHHMVLDFDGGFSGNSIAELELGKKVEVYCTYADTTFSPCCLLT